jgi:hypothetical protein
LNHNVVPFYALAGVKIGLGKSDRPDRGWVPQGGKYSLMQVWGAATFAIFLTGFTSALIGASGVMGCSGFMGCSDFWTVLTASFIKTAVWFIPHALSPSSIDMANNFFIN